MDFIVPSLPEPVEAYLKQYDDLFPSAEAREHFRYYVIGLLSETHRKNISQIMRKVVEGRYQAGHHFLWGSPWEADAVNRRRLALWQQGPATGLQEKGWWIQDDTGQERRRRGKVKPDPQERLLGGTDGVARQYIGNVGKVSEGLVFVSTLYADEAQETGIVADLYWPAAAREKLALAERTPARERDKIEIALDQLEWIQRQIGGPKPQRVCVDSWYGSSPKYLNRVHQGLEWRYLAAIRPNRTLFFRLPKEHGWPEHAAEEVLSLLKADDFERVSARSSGGLVKEAWMVEVSAKVPLKVKGLRHRPRLFLSLEDPPGETLDPQEAEWVLCNDAHLSLAEVLGADALRNRVEEWYRRGKDGEGLDECEMQREERLQRHWVLVMVADSLVVTLGLSGALTPVSTREWATFGEAQRLLQDWCRWKFWGEWMGQVENVKRWLEWFCTSRGLVLAGL